MTRAFARLVRMRPAEVAWRVGAAARTTTDRCRTAVVGARWNRRSLLSALGTGGDMAAARRALKRQRWSDAHRELAQHFHDRAPRFMIAPALAATISSRIGSLFAGAAHTAAARADSILAGEYDLLGYRRLRFGPEAAALDWHYDPVHGRRAPQRFWSTIPYLDPAYGDHKIIWELNRHQHWIALGRAYWLTGDPKYRERFIAELASWRAANPPLVGINWASMLELSFRSLSWIWSIEFFADPTRADEEPWLVDLLAALDRQLMHVERNLSYYFSPNTHLLGEALALYVAGRTLPELSTSARREAIGRRILVSEISRQISSDGGHCERSTHYHCYALDFYLLALTVARITRDPIAAAFEMAVVRLASAARLLADDTGRLPHLGDDDGGELLPLAGRPLDDARDSLAIAAALVDRPELRVGDLPEEAIWMLSHPALGAALGAALDHRARRRFVPSAGLVETGYYISRSEGGDHLVVDGGPHGFGNGGHAHADALALTFTLGGTPLLIDPGTGSYTADADRRDRLRSTASHNTLELDGASQSIPAGPFQWRHAAASRVHRWRTTIGFDFFDASHDGYAPVEHRRRVASLHGDALIVADLVDDKAGAVHSAAVHWHLAPDWHADIQQQVATVSAAADRVGLVIPHGRLEQFRGDAERQLGWMSDAYGRLEPTTTLRVTARARAPFWIVSLFDLNPVDPVRGADTVPIWTEAGSMAHGTALRISRTDSIDYVMFVEPTAGRGRPVWRVAELETDALMLLARLTRGGALVRLALVDGSFVRHVGRGGVRLSLGSVVPALHVDEFTIRKGLLCAASPGS